MDKDTMRILIAGRPSSVRTAIQKMLVRCGYSSVLNAESGRQVVELLKAGGVSFIIIDSELEDAPGLEVLKALKDTDAFADLPMVFCCGQSEVAENSEALALGLAAVLIKPFTAGVFADLVVQILDEMSGQQSAIMPGGTAAMNQSTDDGCKEGASKVEISQREMAMFNGLSVLVVDDSASMLHVLKEYLVRMGIGSVTGAKNGEEAWGLIQGQRKFDLVISDWKMPRLSGIELLDKVRKESGTPDVPFVLVTSEAKTDSILMAGKHSATAYIVKPFCFAEFLVAIRQIFADKTSN